MNTPLRVLFILDNFPDPHAGTEGQFWLLFRSLSRERFDPSILLLRPSAFLCENVPPNRLRVLNVYRLLSIRAILKVITAALWARREGVAVAHIFFNDSSIVFPVLLRMLGIKVVVSRRDLGFWYTASSLPLLRQVGRSVDCVVANCRAVRDVVINKEGFSAGQVAVIYNGIARSLPMTASLSKHDLGLPMDACLLVIVANLRPLKRIDTAISALARLQKTTRTHLMIVGEDRPANGGPSLRAQLQQQADQLGVGDRLHFYGKATDPMPIIASADICVLCSESEGLSNTIIEYMFAAKPIVCTDVGGNGELIEHGRSGFLVPVGDPEALERTISTLLTSNSLAQAVATHARARAVEMFSAEAMVEKQSRLYERLVRFDGQPLTAP